MQSLELIRTLHGGGGWSVEVLAHVCVLAPATATWMRVCHVCIRQGYICALATALNVSEPASVVVGRDNVGQGGAPTG